MGRFETPESLLSRKGSPEELNETEEALYDVLVPENKKRAIKLEDFADLYSPEMIEKDKAYIEKREGQIAGQQTPQERVGELRGQLFEAIVNSQISESDWMGPNADIIIASRYDDIQNGVDSIVEFDREEGGSSHLALAVDVTESPMQMADKFRKIKESIEKNTLSKIKYFKSKNFRGELEGIPRVVVGAEARAVEELGQFILRFKRLQGTAALNRKNPSRASESALKELPKVRDLIANHPMQGMFLNEIKIQLEAFEAYAREKGKGEMADHYHDVATIIDAVIEEKGETAKFDDTMSKDLIYQMIQEKATRFGE